MTRAALLALLWALVALTLVRCYRRTSLRRAALGLLLLAAASSLRHALPDHPVGWQLRADVALSTAWPAVAAWLIAGWPALAWVAYAVALAVWWHRLAEALGWTATEALERARWGWALQLPRYGVGVLATVESLRRRVWRSEAPWTASQRVGLLLAAGQVVMVVADAIEQAAGLPGLWTRWDAVRALSALFYGLCAWVVLTEPRQE